MEIKDLVLEFLRVQEDLKRIEERDEQLRDAIRDYISSQGAKTIKMPQGTFSTVERKTWQYSDDYEIAKEEVDAQIKEIKEPLKKLAKIEELSGVAKMHVKIGLSFKPKE